MSVTHRPPIECKQHGIGHAPYPAAEAHAVPVPDNPGTPPSVRTPTGGIGTKREHSSSNHKNNMYDALYINFIFHKCLQFALIAEYVKPFRNFCSISFASVPT